MSLSRPKFSAALFDCDGVLVDSESITNAVLREMLIELGWNISQEECISIFIGKALKDQWVPIFVNTGVRIDEQWIAGFRQRRDIALREGLQAIPGALDAVKHISASYNGRVACATGADRGKVEMQLSLTKMAPFFGEHVYSGMECAQSKPAPDVYLAAAAGLGIDPSQAAVIEDTVTGVTAGVAAGATVFGYCPGGPISSTKEKLLAAGATAVFTDMAQLPGLLTQN
ncbi:HAD family hydrolase [Glutamicibacter nicotianae]|uniref:Haloacid dehalogenase n=1 Tax=Glutamicibacter nicotianae TaxID=37929 RepID=A0ABQ0RP18_GLUNI|nr:HAD family phosphatase [Glutamicibacter nicotianae]GEC13562.1 haloacid dehalogenase [Glutamicibacter nicotianae]